MLPALPLPPLGDIAPDAARDLLREELSKAKYTASEPSLAQQALDKVFGWLGDLLDRAAQAAPGGYLGLVGLVVLVGALAVVLLVKAGPISRTVRGGGAALLDPTMTADGHRAAADRAAGAGQWADAVRERLRAVVAELETTGLLTPRPGRTAGQVAREAGALNTGLSPALDEGTERFSQIWYGGRTATADDDAALRRLDQQVVTTGGRRRPASGSPSDLVAP